ncbi:hypothetical protein E3Q23_01956 [Wallemia mellicola]|nr:hypothetical protein E3Q24_02078 [Wallemia mellicola]TIB76205.1 hypothetical protein E3Q23_01956 [Wallemia mellicola]TIB88707.1 zf-DHHC-domain-containing protein [Wallemia mellicola]TIB91403.1 zf-DHHC-domain-containing protein [Wallemia mellicola]TIC07044.1 zf-DHHC-domain-containing protein [Wallemia mellicola]
MLELIQKYGLTALVLLLVVATSHSFHSLGLHFGYNILYVLLLSLFGFSYYRACVIEPGYIYYTDEESRVHEWERKSDGSRRFCRKCRIYKPGEVLLSKCSNLTACRPLTPLLIVQQMCVQDGPSLSLVSLFLLLLFYGALLCLYAFGMTTYILVESIKLNLSIEPWYAQLEWAFVAIETFTLGFALLGFFIWHCTLVGSNKTTIEALETDRAHRSHSPRYTAPPTSPESISLPPPPPSTALSGWERSKLTQLALLNIFDRGTKKNFIDVLGWDDNARIWGWWVWFIPSRNTTGTHGQPNAFPVEDAQALKVTAIREELNDFWYNTPSGG